MDDVVGEIQRDFIQRTISVLDLFCENDVPVAIIAGKPSGAVAMYGELVATSGSKGSSSSG